MTFLLLIFLAMQPILAVAFIGLKLIQAFPLMNFAKLNFSTGACCTSYVTKFKTLINSNYHLFIFTPKCPKKISQLHI